MRTWYTYTKDADGEFPGWYTHWGSDGRPTTDRLSACVVYLQGDDDYEGLVGYHEATVEVVAPGDTPASDDGAASGDAATKAASAKSSSAKTGDFSPLAIAGIALVALLAAGGIALAARRR